MTIKQPNSLNTGNEIFCVNMIIQLMTNGKQSMLILAMKSVLEILTLELMTEKSK